MLYGIQYIYVSVQNVASNHSVSSDTQETQDAINNKSSLDILLESLDGKNYENNTEIYTKTLRCEQIILLYCLKEVDNKTPKWAECKTIAAAAAQVK